MPKWTSSFSFFLWRVTLIDNDLSNRRSKKQHSHDYPKYISIHIIRFCPFHRQTPYQTSLPTVMLNVFLLSCWTKWSICDRFFANAQNDRGTLSNRRSRWSVCERMTEERSVIDEVAPSVCEEMTVSLNCIWSLLNIWVSGCQKVSGDLSFML